MPTTIRRITISSIICIFSLIISHHFATSLKMTQFKLYLVRHAETVANRNKVRQGHIDFPLTEEGERMSLALGGLLGKKTFDRVYSSDLGRAQTTLRLAASQFEVPLSTDIQLTRLLREVSYGMFEGLPNHLTFEDVRAIRASERGVDVNDIKDDRESSDSVLDRQHKFLEQVVEDLGNVENSEGINVLCVSHGGYIKKFLEKRCRLKLSKMLDNCSTSVVLVTRNADGSFEFSASIDEVDLVHDSRVLP